MSELILKNNNGLYFDLDFDNEPSDEGSQLYGEISLPESWLNDNVFGAEEMFVCKIDLGALKRSNSVDGLLPKEGRLYFFVDIKKKPFRAVVRFTNEECDAVTGFNDDFDLDCNVVDGIRLVQCSDKTSPLIFAKEELDCVVLLDLANDVYENLLPFGGRVLFVIQKEDLKRLDFSNVKLLIGE